MEIRKEFSFAAAHSLPNVEEGHKCGRVHGHTYRVVLVIDGPVMERAGWVMDFARVSEVWKPLERDCLDHHNLNDTVDINPTAERLARWLYDALVERLPWLVRVEVWETPTAMAAFNRKEWRG